MKKKAIELFLYRIIVDNNLQGTFPNSLVALRIHLSMMVANTAGERSFSKLKLIKNRLKVSTSQDRVEHL